MNSQIAQRACFYALGVGAVLLGGIAGYAADSAPLAPSQTSPPLPPPPIASPKAPSAPGDVVTLPTVVLPPPLAPEGPGPIKLVQDVQATPVQSPPIQAPPIPPPPLPPPPVQPEGTPGPSRGTDASGRAPPTLAGPTNDVTLAANQTPQVLNTNDVGQVLNQSSTSTGIQSQQRNGLVSDPRIRGLRSSQYALFGDSGYYTPVRLDLDTPITRFDAGTVRDVIVVKGPYSVLYGPGLGFLDVETLDSPRFQDGFETHGRTSLNYQTNGQRWNGLQSVWGGDGNWGFRLTYNGQTAADYRAGDGQSIASSYLSQNINFGLGFSLTENSTIELKGQRTFQQNIASPGLYFDVGQLNTEAYSLRYTLRNQGIFDRLVLDTWYNNTTGTGNTSSGSKQAFDQQLLAVSFNPTAFNQSAYANGTGSIYSISQAVANANGTGPLNLFRDHSTSDFATTSLGYRLFGEWEEKGSWRVTTGTDLRVLGQGLQENIQFDQISGHNLNTGALILPGQSVPFTQQQGIPNSNSNNPGLFAEGEFHATDWWTIRGGGRVDWVNSTSHNRLITGNIDLYGPPGLANPNRFQVDPIQFSSDPSDTNLDRNYFLMAGYLQNAIKLNDNLTGTFAVGHSERAPTMTELYSTGAFIGALQQGTSRLIGDPNLRPEKLTQLDVGLQADYGWYKGGISAFYGWVQDYITYDQIKGGPGLTQVVYTNTNLATLAGTEMFSQVDLTNWLTAFATMTYVQGIDQTHVDNRRAADIASSRRYDPATGQFAASTEPLPQMPPLETRLGFRIHDTAPQRRWQVELSARIVNGQNEVARSLGELPTPGFTVYNIRTYWQARENLLLTAGVENVGNKTYREALDPISGNILGVNPFLRPGTNFYFGVQLSY